MVIILFVRLFYANKVIDAINVRSYVKDTIVPIIIVTLLCVSVGLLLFSSWMEFIHRFIRLTILVCCSVYAVYRIGLRENERIMLMKVLKKIVGK